jgi:hypothetical protein
VVRVGLVQPELLRDGHPVHKGRQAPGIVAHKLQALKNLKPAPGKTNHRADIRRLA